MLFLLAIYGITFALFIGLPAYGAITAGAMLQDKEMIRVMGKAYTYSAGATILTLSLFGVLVGGVVVSSLIV